MATIHNASIPAAGALTPQTLAQVRTLADTHEWNLAYNASDRIRAVAGMQLAGEMLGFLNSTIAARGKGANKLAVQFGAYASFFSFFGLAGLPTASPDFTGIPDYASAMVLELVAANASAVAPADALAAPDDLAVRFFFRNGSAAALTPFALFPSAADAPAAAMPWPAFAAALGAVALRDTPAWCAACGNATGVCAAAASAPHHGAHRVSPPVAGIIGAVVALAVAAAALALAALLGGCRVVRRTAATTTPRAVKPGAAPAAAAAAAGPAKDLE